MASRTRTKEQKRKAVYLGVRGLCNVPVVIQWWMARRPVGAKEMGI